MSAGRKLLIYIPMALGVGVGLFATLFDTWGARLILMTLGGVAGMALGGVLSLLVHGTGSLQTKPEPRPPSGFGPDHEELAENYWRDRGYLPFSAPPLPDRREYGGTDKFE